MEVIGYRRTEFTPKGEDTAIKGYSIYVRYDDDNVTGYASDRIFVTDAKLDGYIPAIGDILIVQYNKYGKVQGISVV